MNNTTRLYTQLRNYLASYSIPAGYYENIYTKFQEIFERKEIEEYKNMGTEVYPPPQFAHLHDSMRRAFVEGYLLAQMEYSRENIKAMYNTYKQEIICPPKTTHKKEDVKSSS